MTTATSALNAYMTGLVAVLQTALPTVQVASAPMGDTSARESIQLLDADGTQEWAALGKLSREEAFDLRCTIWVTQPGANEATIQATRARAFVLMAAVELALRSDPATGQIVRVSAVVAYSLDQGANEIGRWVQLDFTIHASKRLPT